MATPESRPTVRRKSSAQNILSSFKSNSIQPAPQILPPSGTPPAVRDWDSQSLVSDSTTTTAATPSVANGGPALSQGTSAEYLRDLVQKRIITLTYIRNVHEARSHWFHTILLSRAELDRVFNNATMKKRTYRFAILGMSLSNLLDFHHSNDFLRGLLNTLAEYDQSKEDGEKPKIRLFKSKLPKRHAGGGFVDYSAPYNDASETSYLVSPHMPFSLDYHQVLLSLLDVLSEIYNKISRILGPSPIPQAAHMMGPLGLLSPYPGVSYLFSGADVLQHDNESSLWGIANASLGSAGGAVMYGGGLGSPPPSWTPALGELIVKADGKLKKITALLLKELDAFARSTIQDELSSLDPLLRNVSVAGAGRELFVFEGM